MPAPGRASVSRSVDEGAGWTDGVDKPDALEAAPRPLPTDAGSDGAGLSSSSGGSTARRDDAEGCETDAPGAGAGSASVRFVVRPAGLVASRASRRRSAASCWSISAASIPCRRRTSYPQYPAPMIARKTTTPTTIAPWKSLSPAINATVVVPAAKTPAPVSPAAKAWRVRRSTSALAGPTASPLGPCPPPNSRRPPWSRIRKPASISSAPRPKPKVTKSKRALRCDRTDGFLHDRASRLLVYDHATERGIRSCRSRSRYSTRKDAATGMTRCLGGLGLAAMTTKGIP